MFGDLEMQIEFGKRHKLLIDNMPNLKALADAALSNCRVTSYDELTLRTLARVAMEDDFWSVIILCANGYANSAKQVLRGMFERVVTLSYLAKHPDEIHLLNDYFRIDQRKRVRRMNQHEPGTVSHEFAKEVADEYEEVKDKYMITDCKKCGTRRLNHMWSKKDLVAMAKEIGFSFDTIENGYYIPLEEAHPKVDALLSRTKEENGSVSYDERPDVKTADMTVMTAAILQMKIFEVLEDYFKIDSMKGPLGPYLLGLSKYTEDMADKRQRGT